MRKWYAIAGLLLIACGSAIATPAAEREETVAQRFDRVLRGLRANAERWHQDQETDYAAEVALQTLSFEPAQIPPLNAALRATEVDANGLYVANRLLRQLTFAKMEAVQAALPAVKALHEKAGKAYKPLPHLSDVQLLGLKKPASSNPKAQEEWEKRLAEKIARDRAVAKHNEMLSTLERQAYRLMLQARTVEEDEVVTKDLLQAEQDKSAMFLTLIDLLAAEARKMSQERGEKIYEVLRPPALELKMEGKRSYQDKGQAVLREEENSEFAVVQDYPGIRLLNMLNRVATAAKQPAMKVPTDKEIAKYQADKHRKPPPPRKKRDGG